MKKIVVFFLVVFMALNMIGFVSASNKMPAYLEDREIPNVIVNDIEIQSDPCPNCHIGRYRIVSKHPYPWEAYGTQTCKKYSALVDYVQIRRLYNVWQCDNCNWFGDSTSTETRVICGH